MEGRRLVPPPQMTFLHDASDHKLRMVGGNGNNYAIYKNECGPSTRQTERIKKMSLKYVHDLLTCVRSRIIISCYRHRYVKV